MSLSEKSRTQLISWIAATLKVPFSRIEQLGTGAVFCQLLDQAHFGKVPLHKVNWKAKQEYQFVNNFKVLQQAFIKLKIARPIDVEKLIKCKYQDNYQMLLWMLKTYDFLTINPEYDPVARRAGAEVQFLIGAEDKRMVRRDSVGSGIPRPTLMLSSKERSVDRGSKLDASQKLDKISFIKDGKCDKENSLSFQREFEELDSDRLQMGRELAKLRRERAFFHNKLMQIDHLLDECEGSDKSAGEVIAALRKLILAPPDKVLLVLRGGRIQEQEEESVSESIEQ